MLPVNNKHSSLKTLTVSPYIGRVSTSAEVSLCERMVVIVRNYKYGRLITIKRRVGTTGIRASIFSVAKVELHKHIDSSFHAFSFLLFMNIC
jgi:hypothetical protein